MDAIQSLTGCTFGKGNLIHLDYGKNAYTFVRRSDGKALRITTKPDGWGAPDPAWQELRPKVFAGPATEEERRRFQELHQQRARDILDLPLEQMFTVTAVQPVIPARTRIHDSATCAGCGESVMETRSRTFRGQAYCIPCFEARDRRY